MAALDSTLRSNFEKEVIKARDEAESAAQAALATLAVERDRPFDSMGEEKRELRRALRARARQLGEGDMNAGMPRLIEEIAYEQWHRMLFARFLAENDLLMHPEGVAVTLEECAELAQEEGAEDLWAVATRYASLMLPGIFRVDDPALQVRFAPEGRHKLEQIVTDLPRGVFTSDDGLGWAYQFWQSKKKDEVNASERKISGADISPVTQLFTEDYMVKFLLHNTLGTWWAHRHPDSPLNKTFEYLRYREDGTPAAGTFDGWPDKVAEVTMMDPCGGSGHFVVAAFEMFTRMRMEEEGLSAAEAGDMVLRDNVHMLELDLRCTQIAVFNLALAAWKAGGYRELLIPNVACSGVPVQSLLEEWIGLANGDYSLEVTLERLHKLFSHAPELGSLINPREAPIQDRMFITEFARAKPFLEKALESEPVNFDPTAFILGQTVSNIVIAAGLLSKRYSLVATNVPYLQRGKQTEILMEYGDSVYPKAKTNLATLFLERCRDFTAARGVSALVIAQEWLFQPGYADLRREYLEEYTWRQLAILGPGAFRMISGEVVSVALLVIERDSPDTKNSFASVDVSDTKKPVEKATKIRSSDIGFIRQLRQLMNPDARVIVGERSEAPLLSVLATSHQGMKTGDDPRYRRFFWEIDQVSSDWRFYQTTVDSTKLFGGRLLVLDWRNDGQDMARRQGLQAWGRPGVAVNQMGELAATFYSGEAFDSNLTAIIPRKPEHLPALWAYCRTDEFRHEVRLIDRAVKKTNSSFVKIPFDLKRWSREAEKHGPIPEESSDEPIQWVFHGKPDRSMAPLQVAVARLLGYAWPRQDKDEIRDIADEDGIVCLPSIIGEPPAAERLRALLSQSFGEDWSLNLQRRLLTNAGVKGKSLEVWLRERYFKQHCKLFNNRPFIWHIWDGRKDGFSVLVNYHKLDHARLERLIYTYLGDWINTQRAEQEQGVVGAEGRLVAALELKKKLELILEGEPPYDIYVRWKPLHEQPIGWNPDLNDGVRLNIRPFVTAGVLRSKFTIHWKKDRGKNPDGSERHNDLHFTRAEKEAAREAALKTR